MKLKEILEICYGKNQREVEVDFSSIPILGTGGTIGYASRPLYEGESVLIGRKGTIGMPFYINKPFWTIDTLFYTKINRSIILPKYLYYCLMTIGLERYSEGAAVPSLTTKTLYDIEINVPNMEIQQHIVNTIGSVDDLIEKCQAQISKICSLLELSLSQYGREVEIEHYHPKIIKSGISEFKGDKEYIDTSSIEGVNNLFSGETITYDKRPSRANMEPLPNSVWFAKMKDSKKKLILTEEDTDIIESNILSTGFQGIEATKEFPLSLIAAIVISDNFDTQRDINSVGTTMAGINNETFLKIKVPLLSSEEIKEYDSKYAKFVWLLSLKRKQINKLKMIKQQLLQKYF